jgi:hypothetical protein
MVHGISLLVSYLGYICIYSVNVIHIMGEAGCSMVFVSRMAYTGIYSVHYTHTHTRVRIQYSRMMGECLSLCVFLSVCLSVSLSLFLSPL